MFEGVKDLLRNTVADVKHGGGSVTLWGGPAAGETGAHLPEVSSKRSQQEFTVRLQHSVLVRQIKLDLQNIVSIPDSTD